jgi:hypothetical protein
MPRIGINAPFRGCCRNLKRRYMLGDGKTSPTASCGCGPLTMVSATGSSGSFGSSARSMPTPSWSRPTGARTWSRSRSKRYGRPPGRWWKPARRSSPGTRRTSSTEWRAGSCTTSATSSTTTWSTASCGTTSGCCGWSPSTPAVRCAWRRCARARVLPHPTRRWRRPGLDPGAVHRGLRGIRHDRCRGEPPAGRHVGTELRERSRGADDAAEAPGPKAALMGLTD